MSLIYRNCQGSDEYEVEIRSKKLLSDGRGDIMFKEIQYDFIFRIQSNHSGELYIPYNDS